MFWVLVCISEIWFFMSMGVWARVWGPRCPVRNVFEMVLPRRDLFLHVFGGAEKVSGAQGTRGTVVFACVWRCGQQLRDPGTLPELGRMFMDARERVQGPRG